MVRRIVNLGVCFLFLSMVLLSAAACESSNNSSNVNPDGSTNSDGNNNNGQDSSSGNDSSSASDGFENPDFDVCDEMEISATAIPPNMLIVVDKSGSMDEPTSTNSNTTKMQDLKSAVDMLLTEGEGNIRFGWMFYPDCTGCNSGYCDPGRVTVQVGDNTVSSIRQRLNTMYSNGGTPTGESLEAADNYFVNLADSNHRSFVLLITDGMPTCPAGNGRQATQADAQLSLEAVQSLHSHGVDTFVIGLGEGINSTNPQLLNDMATAGGRPRSGATKYYQANSLSELQAVLDAIGGMVIGCNVALTVEPEFPSLLWVYFDGVTVPKDKTHINGWDYDAIRNAIDFYGNYCDQLRNGEVENVRVLMACKPPD